MWGTRVWQERYHAGSSSLKRRALLKPGGVVGGEATGGVP
jgi:hypothetical protein